MNSKTILLASLLLLAACGREESTSVVAKPAETTPDAVVETFTRTACSGTLVGKVVAYTVDHYADGHEVISCSAGSDVGGGTYAAGTTVADLSHGCSTPSRVVGGVLASYNISAYSNVPQVWYSHIGQPDNNSTLVFVGCVVTTETVQ